MSTFQSKKPFRTPEEQLAKLISRGLIVKAGEEVYIIQTIKDLGYYRLSGYFSPLQSPRDSFKASNTFSDIMRLYNFDKELRILTSHALKSIEIKLKAFITDLMSSTHESDWYSKPELFHIKSIKKKVKVPIINANNEIEYEENLKQFDLYNLVIEKINENISKNSRKKYIEDFKVKYGNSAVVPSWMMMECISFGTLSKLYSLIILNTSTRKIANKFGCSPADRFDSWIHGFVVLRNHCAHHSRLWNIRPAIIIDFPTRADYKFTTVTDANPNLFYGIGSCLLRALKECDMPLYTNYKTEFNNLIGKYNIDKTAMGFPKKLEAWDIWN